MTYQDKIYKLLLKCNRKHYEPDMHSFRADIKNGVAFVECRGHEIFIETRKYENGNENISQWAGSLLAATNKLELLQIDLLSVEI